ncbi:MAG: ArsA family ATPase [Thermostichales cyanobacterium BF4_bins_65]
MGQILTFLGKGGTGRTTSAVAVAKAAAAQGYKTLLVSQQPEPALALLLGIPIGPTPTELGPRLQVVHLRATVLLEQHWTQARELEAKYVKTPFFKEIYAQELPVLPGFDLWLGLDALRRYEAEYDYVIFDGSGDLQTLRMLGMPEVASWYWRRVTQAFQNSDLAKTIVPFLNPLLQSVTSVNISLEDLPRQVEGPHRFLEAGRQAVADPNRVRAYLVTTGDPAARQTARYLWGSAQMIGLTVGGVLVTKAQDPIPPQEFAPIPMLALPPHNSWDPLVEAVKPLLSVPHVPPPVAVDVAGRTVRLFIPGFDKKQIELSQSGPELTITAGDQRRNLAIPPALAGRQVSGAKFQEPYLVISFS